MIAVQPEDIAAAAVAAAELPPAAIEALQGGLSRKGSLAQGPAGEVGPCPQCPGSCGSSDQRTALLTGLV
jgi:hypothetical protein